MLDQDCERWWCMSKVRIYSKSSSLNISQILVFWKIPNPRLWKNPKSSSLERSQILVFGTIPNPHLWNNPKSSSLEQSQILVFGKIPNPRLWKKSQMFFSLSFARGTPAVGLQSVREFLWFVGKKRRIFIDGCSYRSSLQKNRRRTFCSKLRSLPAKQRRSWRRQIVAFKNIQMDIEFLIYSMAMCFLLSGVQGTIFSRCFHEGNSEVQRVRRSKNFSQAAGWTSYSADSLWVQGFWASRCGHRIVIGVARTCWQIWSWACQLALVLLTGWHWRGGLEVDGATLACVPLWELRHDFFAKMSDIERINNEILLDTSSRFV